MLERGDLVAGFMVAAQTWAWPEPGRMDVRIGLGERLDDGGIMVTRYCTIPVKVPPGEPAVGFAARLEPLLRHGIEQCADQGWA